MKLTKEIQEKLSAPFDDSEVKFKPAAIKNGMALALAYVDARTILDRLDDVLGTENWHDSYEVIASNQVVCKLTIMDVTKSDAGEASPEEKEPLKSALSDSLKRAAVKFGVGRYLYRLQPSWCKYDGARNEFVEKPSIKNVPANSVSSIINNIKEDNEAPNQNCASCGENISNRVAVFSKKYYKKPLCIQCQNNALAEKEKKEAAAS